MGRHAYLILKSLVREVRAVSLSACDVSRGSLNVFDNNRRKKLQDQTKVSGISYLQENSVAELYNTFIIGSDAEQATMREALTIECHLTSWPEC